MIDYTRMYIECDISQSGRIDYYVLNFVTYKDLYEYIFNVKEVTQLIDYQKKIDTKNRFTASRMLEEIKDTARLTVIESVYEQIDGENDSLELHIYNKNGLKFVFNLLTRARQLENIQNIYSLTVELDTVNVDKK